MGINFKSKEIWWDNQRGGTIRESSTIRENTVLDPSKEIIFIMEFPTSCIKLGESQQEVAREAKLKPCIFEIIIP